MAEKKQRRSLFSMIFGRKPSPAVEHWQELRLLNVWNSQYVPFCGNAYSTAQVRAAVHGFAKRAACVKPRHVRYNVEKGTYDEVERSPLRKLLNVKANPTATAWKLFYRAATQYKLYNNAFLYPVYNDRDEITAIYNINASAVKIVEYEKELFAVFEFSTTGKRYVVPYNDVVHIVQHVDQNDIYGESNTPVRESIKLAHSLKQSVGKYAELAQALRGILIVKNGVTKDADLAEQREKFIKNNLAMDAENGGIIVSDGKYEYKELENKGSSIPTEQMKFAKDEIYEYYGTNEKVVTNSADAEHENAYYNGELSPFFQQLEQALTSALCRDGSELLCTSSRLLNASIKDKTDVCKYLSTIAGITLDEVREVYGLPPVGGEEGRRRVQSLNYVAADKVDEYQMENGTKTKKEE